MKKVLPFLLVLISMASFGQKQLYFGIAGSGISPWIINQNNYGEHDLDYKVMFSWAGSIDIGFDFNKHFGLKTEVGLAQLGQKYYKDISGQPDSTINRQVKMNYLMVPLLFKYRTGGDVVRFYLLAGPQFGFLMKATQTYTKGNGPIPPYYNEEKHDSIVISESTITDRYNSFQLFFRIDAGVEFTVAKNLGLHVGLTLNYGLLDINAPDWQLKDADGNYNPSYNAYGGLNFGITYAIPVGKK